MAKIWFNALILVLVILLPPIALPAGSSGEKLVPFTAEDMNGTTINMNGIIGKKPVLLVFWASWCPVCKIEAAKINDLKKTYGQKGLEFIGINVGKNDSVARARAFMKKTGMDYPVIYDNKSKISAQYTIIAVPTIIVADKTGTVVFHGYSVPDESVIKNLL